MELDFNKCKINPKGWNGYIKIVYKETPKSSYYTSIHKDTIKIILKLLKKEQKNEQSHLGK